MQDSPRTPITPIILAGISSTSQRDTGFESRSGGRWTSLHLGTSAVYSPPSVVVAKRFLRWLPPSRSLPKNTRSVTDTPVSSRQGMALLRPGRIVVCHGCHGKMGDGNHNGSGPGKNVCTLPHSSYCQGGVQDTESWRACPAGYFHNFASGVGFSQTLDPQDFQSVEASTPANDGLFHHDNILQNDLFMDQAQAISNQPAAAQQKAQDDLQLYRRQIRDAEAKLAATQQAFHRLQVDDQLVTSGAISHRQSVLRPPVRQQAHQSLLQPTHQPIHVPHQGHLPPNRSRYSVGGPVMQTIQSSTQSSYEVVMGADGQQYKVPRSQMSEIPTYEIVTGADGRQYKVAKSSLSIIPVSDQTGVSASQPRGNPDYLAQQHNRQPSHQSPHQLSQQLAHQPAHQPLPGLPSTQQRANTGASNDQYAAQAQVQQQQNRTVAQSDGSLTDQLREKMKGIVSLVEGDGARKPAKLLDYVKKCPAKWCKNVKNSSMNLPVYVYGVIAELNAALTGRSDPISGPVLLAKLQHLQNVVEICCINSAEAEYCNYGWVLARDYALKVNDKVDQGLSSWDTACSGIQTDVLVSAQMEFPRPAKEKDPVKKLGSKDSGTGLYCGTYNRCSTEGKCDYEVSNPGKTCQ